MRQRRGRRKTGLKLILVVVLLMFGILGASKARAEKEERELETRKKAIAEQTRYENERTAMLRDEAAYRETRAYIEEYARENMGLVMPDEIILREEQP